MILPKVLIKYKYVFIWFLGYIWFQKTFKKEKKCFLQKLFFYVWSYGEKYEIKSNVIKISYKYIYF